MSKEDAVSNEDAVSAPALKQLYVYLTDGCNLACRHCWVAPRFDPDRERSNTLSVAHFEAALREAKPLGLRAVKLTGGEPLLHPQILHVLEVVQREALQLYIETNGLLCTPEVAAAIAACGQRDVSVSIDGADAATHDAIRGVPGAFERAKQALRNLAEAGVSTQIIMTVMRRNVEQVDAMVPLAEELGASLVKFNIVQPTAKGQRLHDDDESPGVAEIIRLGRYVDRELAATTRLELQFDYPLAFRPLSRIASGAADCICGILGILGLLASGHWALCGMGRHVEGLVFGKLGTDRLEDVWRESATLQELRTGLPARLTGICAQCLMRHKCIGACISQNYYRTGSLWGPYWFCERAAQEGLFPASRRIPDR